MSEITYNVYRKSPYTFHALNIFLCETYDIFLYVDL